MPDGNDVNAARGDGYEGGSGSTLLLLHGLGGTWHIWRPVFALLEKHHRVIALTLPGHMGGPPLGAGIEPTVESIADELLAELRRRGIDKAHVAGNSLGGWLSLELGRRGFAQSVTALSPAGSWKNAQQYEAVSKPFRIVFAILPVLIFLTTLLLRFAGMRRWLNKQAMEHGYRVPEADFRGSMVSMARTSILPALLVSMGREGPIKAMSAGDVPVTIAWCEKDKVIPYETYGRNMIETVSGAEIVVLKGCGHVPMYDDPEQVSSVILANIARAEKTVA